MAFLWSVVHPESFNDIHDAWDGILCSHAERVVNVRECNRIRLNPRFIHGRLSVTLRAGVPDQYLCVVQWTGEGGGGGTCRLFNFMMLCTQYI